MWQITIITRNQCDRTKMSAIAEKRRGNTLRQLSKSLTVVRLEQHGVWLYVVKELDLDIKWKPIPNEDARTWMTIRNRLKELGLIHKPAGQFKRYLFVSVEAMETAQVIIRPPPTTRRSDWRVQKAVKQQHGRVWDFWVWEGSFVCRRLVLFNYQFNI